MTDARIDEIRKRVAPFWIDRNLEGDWLVRDKDHVCFRSVNEVNAREAHKELTNAFNASRADIEYLLAKLDAAERLSRACEANRKHVEANAYPIPNLLDLLAAMDAFRSTTAK